MSLVGGPRAHLSPGHRRCGGPHCLSVKDIRVSPREGRVAPAPTRHRREPGPHPAGRGQRAGAKTLCQPSSLPWELTPWDILGAQRSLGNKFWAQDRLIRALGGLRTVGRAGRGRPIRGDEQISPLPRSEFRNQPARAGWGGQGPRGPQGLGVQERPCERPTPADALPAGGRIGPRPADPGNLLGKHLPADGSRLTAAGVCMEAAPPSPAASVGPSEATTLGLT